MSSNLVFEIPEDFNSKEYLQLNPDVMKAGVDPRLHYINYGIKERREYKRREFKISTDIKNFVADRIKPKEEKFGLQVSCLMMQKNEGELLRSWIEHHGNIFGISNLWIFDNGSDDPLTIKILNKYDGFGVNIIYDKKNHSDFELSLIHI